MHTTYIFDGEYLIHYDDLHVSEVDTNIADSAYIQVTG